MATYRTLELTLLSAKDLKKVNFFSRMEVYALVTLSGDPRSRQRTPPDRENGRNPTWTSANAFRLPIPGGDPGPLALHVLLRTERLLGDRDVGEVVVPLRELLSSAGAVAIAGGSMPVQFVSYQVRRRISGKAKGVLDFSYRVDSAAAAAAPAPYPPPVEPAVAYPPPVPAKKADEPEPVTAYPAAYPPPYGAPPVYGYGYGYPPQPAYGYGYPQPAAAGYGYGVAPAPAPARKTNNAGLALGAGLLGGFLLGDMISDAAAYDAGFGDSTAFDF